VKNCYELKNFLKKVAKNKMYAILEYRNFNQGRAECLILFYADEADEQLQSLDKSSRNKILKSINIFKVLGKDAKNSRDLKNGLWEIKADNVRAYFKYYKNKIVIIGFIVLKKTQKAPERFIQQAIRNIDRVILELQEKMK
jgi:phage-related protein